MNTNYIIKTITSNEKNKIICGLTILLVVMAMNMRHAWMNYGIAKDSMLAGLVADSGNVTPTHCDTKFTYQVVEADRKEIPQDKKTSCVVRVETLYYEVGINGKEYPVATVIYDLATEKTSVVYEGNVCSYEKLPHRTSYIQEYLTSRQISCSGKYEPGFCCYPQDAIIDCSILVKMQKST